MKNKLDEIIKNWNLSNSPFYVAWSNGTLPKDALRQYASEYGVFISLLPQGWKTLKDFETEHEEEEHYEMWCEFAESIYATMIPVTLVSSKKLISIAKKLFANKVSAIGAMYAFEVQQPQTAQSKLKGLQTHYADLSANEEYFTVHSHNEHEAEKLLKMMEGLSRKDQKVALKACETMCKALWNGLSGLYPEGKVN